MPLGVETAAASGSESDQASSSTATPRAQPAGPVESAQAERASPAGTATPRATASQLTAGQRAASERTASQRTAGGTLFLIQKPSGEPTRRLAGFRDPKGGGRGWQPPFGVGGG